MHPAEVASTEHLNAIPRDLFENQTQETERAILNEVQRVAGGDPRIYISQVNIYPQLNGILIELQLQVVGASNAEILSIFFDQQQRNARYV